MCFTVDQIDRACGLLLLTEFNTFVYCCKSCQCDFDSGPNLEVHILSAHQDSKEHIENVFVSDEVIEGNFGQDLEDQQAENYPISSAVLIEHEPIDIKIETKTESVEKCEPNSPVTKGLNRRDVDEQKQIDEEAENNSEDEKEDPADNDFTMDDCSNDSDASYNPSQNVQHTKKSTKSQNEARKFDSDDSYDPFHEDAPKKRAYRRRALSPDARLLYCDMCPGVSFRSKSNLQVHMKRHIENRLGKFCPYCNKKTYKYEKHLRINHLDTHPFKCDYQNCEKVFTKKNHLDIHQRKHTGETPYLCPNCGKAFRSFDSLQKHQKRLHSNIFAHKYKCKECDQTFHHRSHLKDHMKSSHSDARPHACETCGKKYTTKKYLQVHKQFHGEKKWKCNLCDKKFFTSGTRRFHEKTVHNIV